MNNNLEKQSIRISLPSKGRLADDCLYFLEKSGLDVYKPNPRQYEASIPSLPEVRIIFQRASDIVTSVRDGSIDFGITGYDVVAESNCEDKDFLVIHDSLGFGHCSLQMAIPENWEEISTIDELADYSRQLGHPLRIATKYKNLVTKFLAPYNLDIHLVSSEGTVEIAPAIGYADVICDVVSSGLTLSDNRLKMISGGKILASQSVLIANKKSLENNPDAMRIARTLIELFEAYLIAKDKFALFANMRGESPTSIADKIFNGTTIQGLQGPTISQVIVKNDAQNWYAVNIVVSKSELFKAISELREIGGSGVIVVPVNYIFDEEPPRYRKLLDKLQQDKIG
jgi:ATP phosphoribosyltransferase